jgi:hypothetical protein
VWFDRIAYSIIATLVTLALVFGVASLVSRDEDNTKPAMAHSEPVKPNLEVTAPIYVHSVAYRMPLPTGAKTSSPK